MIDNTPQLAAALAKVQAALPKVERDRTVEVTQKSGGTYSYRYVTLANLSDAILPLLAKHGLCFVAMPGAGADGKMCVRYHLLHESGEQLSGEFPISGEGGIQMIGGRITYARRYCLAAVVGVAADEDDEARLADDGQPRTAQRAARPAAKPAKPAAGGTTVQRARPASGPPPLPGEDGNAVTKPQMAKMQALFAEANISDPQAKRDYCTQQLGRVISSVAELSKADAVKVIDALTSADEPRIQPEDDEEAWLAEQQPPLDGEPS